MDNLFETIQESMHDSLPEKTVGKSGEKEIYI